MRILYRDRRKGKTTDALDFAHKNRYAFVVHTQVAKKNIEDLIMSNGWYDTNERGARKPHVEVFTIQEVRTKLIGRQIEGLVIDDAELCLAMMMGVSVKMITLSPTNE